MYCHKQVKRLINYERVSVYVISNMMYKDNTLVYGIVSVTKNTLWFDYSMSCHDYIYN